MAVKYLVGTGSWGSTSSWSLAPGGAGGQPVPTAADDVVVDNQSPSTCTVDTSARVCRSLVTAGWTGTLEMNQTLSVSGHIQLSSTTTVTGTGKLESIANTGSNHILDTYIPVLGFRGAVTHTISTTGSVPATCGNLFLGTTTNATVVNGNDIEIAGNLDMTLSTTGVLSGTADLVMTGTGQIKYPTSTGVLRNALKFNTSGTITFATGTFRYNTGVITHIAGTVDASGCDLNITAATTLDCGANVTWKTISVTGTTTLTLTSDCYVSGLATLAGTTLTTTLNGSNLRVGGGLTINGTTGIITGTTVIVLTGTGTLTVATTTGLHACDLKIDAGAGTITTSGTIRYALSRIQYLSGTVVTSAGTWATAGGGSGGAFTFVG